MNCIKRTHGAISVFLVMILVPCIVVTSVFVDLGRVHMSKSMADSAGDLALNSLMTNYDSDLNEWYGMVASCQSIDEFYDVSAQFFLRTISSQGLSDNEIYLLSDYYANATNDDSIYDLLQIECQTAPSEMIKAVDGANLSNATMLKDQVVEFMKYRAPIELTTSLIERLKNDNSVAQAVECDDNKELVDDKSDYYEAEGELLAAALNSYVAIYDYFKDATTNGLTSDKLKQYSSRITSYKTSYSQIHALTVSNLFNTDGLSKYNRATLSIDTYNSTYTEKSSDVYSKKEAVDGSYRYVINGSKIKSLLDNLEQEISDFNTAKTNYETASNTLMSSLPGSSANQANAIQWWVQMNAAVNAASGTNHTSKVYTAGQNMLKAYSKVLAISKCELDDGVSSDWQKRYNTLTSKVQDIQSKYLKVGTTDSNDKYLKAVNRLEEVSNANLNFINSSSLYVSVNGQNKSIDEAIPFIKTDLTSIRSELQGYVDQLNIAIDGNENDRNVAKNDKVKSLDKLLTLARNYDSSLATWTNTADKLLTSARNYDSSLATWTNTANTTKIHMAEDDKTEIAEIEQVCQEINENSVRTLKTRLSNIRTQLKSVISAIDSMKYGGSKVIDIGSFSTLKNATKTKVTSSNIKLKNQEITDYSNTTFSQLFAPSDSSFFALEHTNDDNYNPVINPKTKQVNTPELFIYFQEKFKGLSKQDVNAKQDELDGGKAAGSKKSNEAKENGRYHGGGKDITKDFSGTGTFDLADGAISGVIDLFKSLINVDVTSIRDDLYATSYIMNMFSYATYENEGLYNLIDDKTSLDLSNYPTKYQALMGSAETEKTWLSSSLKDSYNKSLTNKLINKANNSAYGAEIEYILYGGREDKGNDDNVKSVYSNIYGLRYVLNLVSGFANFWSAKPNNTTSAAIETISTMIQGATGGIIPAPLTKVVLIPILTAFETSKDLDRLEAGFPVELYKSSYEDWWISVPKLDSIGSFTAALSGGFNGPNKDKGIFYSDYLTVFVYLGLKSSFGEAMYQRMAEVIQSNMLKLTHSETYSMKKSQVYFKLDATIRVKPLMITLPYFNDYKNNMSTKTDWCTYRLITIRGYS